LNPPPSRFPLLPLLLGFLAACPESPRQLPPTAGGLPDIWLITLDTIRADELGYSGGQAPTPTFDALAHQGRVYSQAWAATNMTAPSHAILFTGRSGPETGVAHNGARLSPGGPPTLAEHLSRAGYHTIAVAGVPFLIGAVGRGFQHLWGPDGRLGEAPAGLVAAHARSFLESAPPAVPLFLWTHFFDGHAPYAPPPELALSLYPPGDPHPAPPQAPWAKVAHIPGSRILPPPGSPTDPAWPAAMHAAELAAIDVQIGPLLDQLQARQRPLLVVLLADHGESFGEQGVWFNHAGPDPANFHIPLFLWGTGVTPGEDPSWATHRDLFPSLLAAIGQPSSCDLRRSSCGHSLLVLDDLHTGGGLLLRPEQRLERRGPSDYGPAFLRRFQGASDQAQAVPADDPDLALLETRRRAWAAGPQAPLDPQTATLLRELGYLPAEPAPLGPPAQP
jgi:arylsulfatase A-like enzyme